MSQDSPDNHFAFEVITRYVVPDITMQQANIVKLVAKRRELTAAEKRFFAGPKPLTGPT